MQEELEAIQALTAERTSLRLLVSELLLENQNLRLAMAKNQSGGGAGAVHAPKDFSAPAIHPQPHPDR